MSDEEKELTFPIEHNRCPVCQLRAELAEILGKPELKLSAGSESRRVADVVKKQEVEKKKVREKAQFALGRHMAAISDPDIVALTCPIITSLVDVCADCGCVWSPITTYQEQQLTSIQQQGGGQNLPDMPPFFGGG
jgi:hypothetical protein